MASPNVEAVRAGQSVAFDNEPPITVLQACADKNNGRWRCITHNEDFGNQLQKDFHIAHGVAHSLVWVCFAHGLEQP